MYEMLIISAFLIVVNAVFVLVEFSLVKVRASRIELLARKGNKRAHRTKDVLAHLDTYLAALQLGITVVSLALGWIGEPALAELLMRGFHHLPFAVPDAVAHGVSLTVGLMILAFIHITFGELVPRAIGIQRAESVAMWGALPLSVFATIFKVPVAFMSWFSIMILKALGFRPAAETDSVFSEDEMRILLGETQEKGTIPLERLLLLENLFDFGGTSVAEAMVPMSKVATLSLARPWEENLKIIKDRRFSRYPLCQEESGPIIGFIHTKDLLVKAVKGKTPELMSLKRDIVTISRTDNLEKHLKAFPDKGIHMALVKDDSGAVVGILTLEDIVEEIIGEIHDEFDLREAWSLMDVVDASSVAVHLQAEDIQTAIWQLLNKLKASNESLDTAEAFSLIWDREKKLSSGVGRGVAVPHARLSGLDKPMVALGHFTKPIPFAVPDNVPVRLVFLILTPSKMPLVQLKILARIASLATNENVRRKLLRARSHEALVEVLRVADTMLAE